MSKKKIILMSNIFLLLIFICSSFSSANASTREWQPGDLYNYGERVLVVNSVTNIDTGHKVVTDVYTENEIKLNVTAIDILLGTYTARWVDTSGTTVLVNNFLMDDFVDINLGTSNVFNIGYSYDQEHNRTVLSGFDIFLATWYLIEPDWPVLMQGMLDTLNESEIVAQVADPYDPILHNITFSQFLNDVISYSINGKYDIAKAKANAIKDDTTSYEFIFDVSSKIFLSEFNATLGYNIYSPYEKYIVTTKMEYSEGGILNYYQYQIEYGYTNDNLRIDYTVNYEMILGGLESFDANFASLVVIPAIISVAVGLKIAQKRRRKR